MNKSPFHTDDLTGSVKIFAERLEPRLAAGAKTFQSIRLLVAALAPLVVAAFVMGIYSAAMARKSDVTAQSVTEQTHHEELERRTAVLEDARRTDEAQRAAADSAFTKRLDRIDDRLDDIIVRLGATQTKTGARK